MKQILRDMFVILIGNPFYAKFSCSNISGNAGYLPIYS
mgnify:CR=1 FL=1